MTKQSRSQPFVRGAVLLLLIVSLTLPAFPNAAQAQNPTSIPFLINELDSDTPGTDALEFVELYDGGVGNSSLTGLVVVFYNGSNDLSYYAADLDTYSTDAAGYFVMGNAAVPGVDLIFAGNLLQNGQDAVGLYAANGADFPANTPVTTANLVDALVYDTSDVDDPGLLVLLNPNQPQIDENSRGVSADDSNQRCPNGSGGARNTTTYIQAAPTAGAANNCPVDAPPSVTATDPADGASGVAADANLTVTFSENVNVADPWFDITCTTSGSHGATVSGGPQVFVLDPGTDLNGGESCTATIVASQVTDQDTNDPPDNMTADYAWTFTVAVGDVAPWVSGTDPVDGASGVPAYAGITITFSEPVDVWDTWFDITCAASGNHLASVSGGPTTFTLDPVDNLSPGESCTVTVYASQVTDQDADDPPDNMTADYAWSFTVDPVGPCNELFFSEYVEGSSYNKAVEIVNPTASAISLTGYDVQVYFNGSTSPGSTIALPAASLAAGDVWLLCHNQASFQASCDQVSSNLSFNGDDAVVLRHNGSIIDSIGQVGYDPGTEWGSGDLSTQDNTIRRKQPVSYGDALAADGFSAALLAEWDGYPPDTFGGLGSHAYLCGEVAPYVIGTLPDDGKIQVPVASNLTVNFKEPVNATGAAFELECSVSGANSLAVTGGPVAFTLDPTSDFASCESCTLRVLSDQVTDQDGDDPPDNMDADYAFSFSTACGCNTIPIIQGTGSSSPCALQYVTISGCVTGVAGAGFYMQDVAGDGNPASSDGIYVYMYGAWTNPEGIEVGYSATAANMQVQEYYGATELSKGSGSASKGAACTLPAPVEVPQITALGPHNVDQYESTEFMRVQMDLDGFVQGPTKRFTSRFANGDPEIGFVYTPLVGSLPNSPRLFEEDYAGAGSLNYLSGGTNRNLPDLDWGDTFTAENLVGVMAYQFDKWQLVVDEVLDQSLVVTDDPDPLDTEAPFAPGQFGICTYNVENMFDWIDDGDGDIGDWQPPDETTYQVMLEKRARGIVENLQKCPILAVQEMEGKDQVWDDLEGWIETIAGPGTDFEWDYYESQDVRDITVGVFYDTTRVTLLGSTQRQGCTPVDYGVSYASAQGARVIPNPCGSGAYPLYDRPPYVAQLQPAGGPVITLVVNHLKSMSGGEAETRPRREAQAEHNAELAWEYSATTPHLAIAGDLNDYIGSTPIQILNNATTQDGQPLVNVHVAHVPKADQYTYIFDGESEVLDYVFLSQVLDDMLLAASPMHINADYPDVRPMDSDNCAGGVCTFDVTPLDTSSLHASDHDPVFVRFGGLCEPVHDSAFTWQPDYPAAGGWTTFEATAQGTGPIDYAWVFGDGATGNGNAVSHTYATPGTYPVTLTAGNACGQEVVEHTVQVWSGARIGVSPTSLSSEQCAGAVTSHTLQVCNSGDAPLEWMTFSRPLWVGMAPSTGLVPPGDCMDVEVTFDSTGRDPGTIAEPVQIYSNDPTQVYVYYPVSMTVLDPAHDPSFVWTPLEAPVGEEVTFVGAVEGDEPIQFTWDYGDGGAGSGAMAQHAYAAAGDYLVTLTAANGCGQASVQHTVTVQPAVANLLHLNRTKLVWRAVPHAQFKFVVQGVVHDQDDQKAGGVTVLGYWTYPDGSVHPLTLVTDALGRWKSALRSAQTGVFQFCVTDLVRAGYTYDPGANEAPACRAVTVP